MTSDVLSKPLSASAAPDAQRLAHGHDCGAGRRRASTVEISGRGTFHGARARLDLPTDVTTVTCDVT
jgi:hypothetical protein